MQINFNKIPNDEQQSLKERIHLDLIELKQKESKRRKKKRLVYYFAAASVVGAFAFFINRVPVSQTKPQTQLELFAASSETNSNINLENISLVLQDKQTIAVKDSTVISYQKNGQKVTVGQQAINTNTNNTASFNTVRVPYGKRTQIMLADGTTVWLNSGSSLIYPTLFDGSIREVYLTGEAAFDVAHDKTKPFYVKTKDCNVRVLGTVFNVSSYPEDETVQTALLKGKVRITYTKKGLLGDQELQEDITPGMIATINKDKKQLKVEKREVASILSWRDGYFTFKSQPLSNILNKLSKYYKIEFIKGSNLNLNANYSGSFALNENLNSLADALSSITNNTCTVNANQRTITIK